LGSIWVLVMLVATSSSPFGPVRDAQSTGLALLLKDQLGAMEEATEKMVRRTASGKLDSGGKAPRALLVPPPPPAPPPHISQRHTHSTSKNIAPSPRVPSAPALPLRQQSSPAQPSQWAAPKEELLQDLLHGLEEDSLTVADVLDTLETELRTSDRGQDVATAPITKSSTPRSQASLQRSGSYGQSPWIQSRGQLQREPWTQDETCRHDARAQEQTSLSCVRPSMPSLPRRCEKCPVLDQQVHALAQSLAGLGWSLARCLLLSSEPQELMDLTLRYLAPCKHVDDRIADACASLSSAKTALTQRALMSEDFGSTSTAPALRRAQEQEQCLSERSNNPNVFRGRDYGGDLAISTASSPPGHMGRNAPQVQQQAHVGPPILHRSPSLPSAPIHHEVIVNFQRSEEARTPNGVYTMLSGLSVNRRPVFHEKLGKRYLVHLDDGVWAIKETPDGDPDGQLYAYAEDSAALPSEVRSPWWVMDQESFAIDKLGTVSESGLGNATSSCCAPAVAPFREQQYRSYQDEFSANRGSSTGYVARDLNGHHHCGLSN